MFRQISWLATTLLFSTALFGQNFRLDERASDFPHEDFEEAIAFWVSIFSHYDENEVVFHDRNDVSLIYHVERFSKGIEGDAVERKQQRRKLKQVLATVQKALRELAKGNSKGSELQSAMRSRLQDVGKNLSSQQFRQLADTVRMQRGVRSKFAAGLKRSGQYLPYIQRAFQEQGLPAELAMLPHVESSFAYAARSSAGASGIWQLMRGTSRSLLTINRSIDERLDPIAATRAAAHILKENYQSLGNWPLAVTAYNHGANGIRRARNKYGDDLTAIIEHHRSRLFGFASKNFYAEFLAAVFVAKNRHNFFPGVALDPALEFDVIRLSHRYEIDDLVEIVPLSKEALKALNPYLTRSVWSSGIFPAAIDLRVPPGSGEQVKAELEKLTPAPGSSSLRESDGQLRYRVQRGDTLAKIARRHGISERSLQAANAIPNKHRIYQGQLLVLPENSQTSAAGATPILYTVQKGDSLAAIARRFGTSIQQLQALNSIRNRNQIYPGQKLQLQGVTRYRVKRGDTLAHIARRFRTSVARLQTANGIGNANRIYQGQVLRIPAGR